jgi:transposase
LVQCPSSSRGLKTVVPVLLQSEMEERAFGLRDKMVPFTRSPQMSSNPARRNYNGDEKMGILRGALLEKISISDVCQKHGITPDMFYEWQKKLFEQGSVVLNGSLTAARQSGGEARKLAAAEARIQQKNEVLAELMSEHEALKKKLGLI